MNSGTWCLMVVMLGGAVVPSALAEKVKKSEVPQAVLTALASRYPKSTVRNYLREKKENQVTYEIETRDDDVKRDLVFGADGNILEVEESIHADALPEAVRLALTAKYSKAKIKNAEKITQGPVTEYEVVLKQGKKSFEKIFESNGQELPIGK